ncbi:alpha/beta fold hydrolase [Methylocaldum sp. MU1018]
MMRRVLTIVAALVFTLSVAADEPPGRLVDVGGYRLHIRCMGRGTPPVILDHGLGGSSADWAKVQSRLATVTQVCVYDRAGYGFSDRGPSPRTSSRIAGELRTLLDRVRQDVPPPYVLAGHSFGGYNMRMFAGLFPEQTAGLVLVDTPHEDQAEGIFEHRLIREIDPHGMLQGLWEPGLLSAVAELIDPGLLAPSFGVSAKTLQAILAEAGAYEESGRELRSADIHPDMPFAVIMHGVRIMPDGQLGDDIEREWLRLQRGLAGRYKTGEVLLAEKSAHNIPLDEPELIVDAIRKMIDSLRNANSLRKHDG